MGLVPRSWAGDSLNRLMVIHYPFFGGPHNQALRLSGPLHDMGIDTTVVMPTGPGNAAERLGAAGIAVEQVNLHRLRARFDPRVHLAFLLGFLQDVRVLRRVIRERSIDVVEVNGLVNPQAAIAARLERVPVIWQLLDTRAPRSLRWALMPIVRLLADVVMTTGVEVARAHPGALALGNRLIPFVPPVDTDSFRPDQDARHVARRQLRVPEGSVAVGCVANITPQKGLEYFLEAAKQVSERRSEVRFILFGRKMETQAAYCERIEATAALLTAQGRLAMLDPGDRVGSLLPALDIFLATSVRRSEGISTTVVEAMATGLPVVTTDVGALSEVVEDGVTGFVVPPLDVDRIVDAVLRLIDDEELRAEMGLIARSRALRQFGVLNCARTHARACAIARSRA